MLVFSLLDIWDEDWSHDSFSVSPFFSPSPPSNNHIFFLSSPSHFQLCSIHLTSPLSPLLYFLLLCLKSLTRILIYHSPHHKQSVVFSIVSSALRFSLIFFEFSSFCFAYPCWTIICRYSTCYNNSLGWLLLIYFWATIYGLYYTIC